jgi:hypothetical protein
MGIQGLLEHNGLCGWGLCGPTLLGWFSVVIFWASIIWFIVWFLLKLQKKLFSKKIKSSLRSGVVIMSGLGGNLRAF